MKHKALAMKRHKKALARKHKHYTGPKYSRFDMLAMIAPLMDRAGIDLFGHEKIEGVRMKEAGTSEVQSKTEFV